jgi:hypothetical protein
MPEGNLPNAADIARQFGAAETAADLIGSLPRDALLSGVVAPEDIELRLAEACGDVAAIRCGIGLPEWPEPLAKLERRLIELEEGS